MHAISMTPIPNHWCPEKSAVICRARSMFAFTSSWRSIEPEFRQCRKLSWHDLAWWSWYLIHPHVSTVSSFMWNLWCKNVVAPRWPCRHCGGSSATPGVREVRWVGWETDFLLMSWFAYHTMSFVHLVLELKKTGTCEGSDAILKAARRFMQRMCFLQERYLSQQTFDLHWTK